MGWEDDPLVTSEEPLSTNPWEADPLIGEEGTNPWEADPLVEKQKPTVETQTFQSNIVYQDKELDNLNKKIEDNINNYFRTSAITEETAILRATAPPSLAIRPEIREQMMQQEQPAAEPEQQGIRSLTDQFTALDVFHSNELSKITEKHNLEKILEEDPLLVDVPLVGKTPLWQVMKHAGLKSTKLITDLVPFTGDIMDKPALTELLEQRTQEIAFSEDTPMGKTSRIFSGIGETSGDLFQLIAIAELGWGKYLSKATPALIGGLSFGTKGGLERLGDPEQYEEMTPTRWVVGTGLDTMLGAAFPWMGRIGGEVIRTPNTLAAFSKYLLQTGVMTTGITATQFTEDWVRVLGDNPEMTALEGLTAVGGELNWAQLGQSFLMMAAMHAAGTYTRFLPAKKGTKETAIVVYDPKGKNKTAFNKEWFDSLSGKQKAVIYDKQIKWARDAAKNMIDIDPATNVAKPIKAPNTLEGAQQVIRRQMEWAQKLMHGKEIPVELETAMKARGVDVKTEPIVKPEKPVKPVPIKVKPEKPVEPVKPTEIVKEPKIEPVEVPKEPVTPVEVTPVSPEITPEVKPEVPVEAPTKAGIQTLSTDWVMKNVNRQVEEIPKPTTEEPNKGAAWRQFTKEIEKEGIKEPIEIVKTDKGWFLSDGLHRLLSANEIGIKDLKVNVVISKKTKPTTEAVQTEQATALNKQYSDLLDAQSSAQVNLMREDLAGMQKQQLEQSFEQTTKRLEDLELEAKTKGITLEKKITETEAIKEVVDLFKELDPEVDYQTKLDELRTLQDNIDDPLSPETPENALAQIEAAGQELAGVEPADLAIAGENYQELRDGALVDVIKIYQGANMLTVGEERIETWYRQQEQLHPDTWNKKITEVRKDYHEKTGEKDDPSQSNGEWFSDRGKENLLSEKKLSGKVPSALARLFRKFREYVQALRKSADRFAKYVKQGKVSKELKSFLDRSVSEKLRTAGEIKTIKEGTAVKTGVPNYELILKKKARTHSELKKLIPESQRVVVKKGKNEPYPHVSGSKFKDLPALEKTESNVTVTQSEINKAYNDALKSAGIDPAGLPADMEPMGVDFWNDALSLPDQVRYWYEISAEAFGGRLVDMTPAEIQTALAVSSAASVQATPDLQIARTISILAQVEQGKPVTVGTPVPKTVQDALFKSLKGLKTGNFEQTFSYILGYVPEAPLSTNDRQVAAYFNISPDLLGSEGNLYEALSKFHINIRDVINKKLPEGVQPYESWQLQALPWVQMRRNKGVSLESNDLQQALDNTLVKLENAGIDVPRNPAGDMIITKELLNNPKVIDVLSPTSKQFEQAKIATVEVGTTLTPEGKSAAKLNSNLKKLREGVTDLRKLNSIDKALDEYDSIRRRNLGKLSRPNANLGGKSIVDNIIQTVTGRVSKVSRIEYGRGVGGTYEGVFSPNIRIPLVTKFTPKGVYALDGNQTNQMLALLGDKLEQAAMAASSFTNAEASKAPDTHSALIEHEGIIDSKDIEVIENLLNKESGLQFSFNIKKVPNGTVVDVNPHFNEDFTMTAPDKHILSSALKTVLGDKVDIKFFDNTYISNYIEQPEYANYIKDLKNEISRRHIEKLQSQIGGTKKRISQAVKGRKEVGNILEGFSKSDISRAEKARLRYRNDSNSLRETTKEIDRIASSIRKEDAQWGKTHSSKLPTYELKKLTPEQKRLREERKRRDEIAQKKKTEEIYEDLKSLNTDALSGAEAKAEEIRQRTGKKPPIYAGSVNLDKLVLDDALKSFAVALGKLQPKKKVTWDETGRIRDEILSDYKSAIKMMKKGKKHGILKSAEIDALRQIAVNGIYRLKEMSETGSDAAALRAVENYYIDVFKLLNDVTSEVGRALNIFKRQVSEQRMARAWSQLSRNMNEREIEEFKNLNMENPLEVERFIKRLGDPLLMDYVYEFWYNSILSGVPTHLVNIISNTLWGTYQVPFRALSGGIDALITKFTGKERQRFVGEIVPMMAGMGKGWKAGAKRAGKVITTGQTPLDLETKWDLDMGGSVGAFERSPKKFLRDIAPAMSMVGRALRAMDVWANSIAFDAQINALSKRMVKKEGLKGQEATDKEIELRKNPTTGMINDAKDYAKYTTFMDNPDKVTALIAEGRSKIWLGRFFVPFVNTLSNIFKRGWEHTPVLGLVRNKEFYKGTNQGYKNSASDLIAKHLIGTVIAAILIAEYDEDRFTGAAPENKKEREQFYELGKLPWAIRFGDEWVQYRRIEPFNMVLATATIVAEQMKKFKEDEIEEVSELFFALADRIYENLIDSSMLSGLSDMFNRHGKRRNIFKRFGATFVPYSSFWRSINRSIEVGMEDDAKVREIKTLSDAFAQNIPFGTLRLKPRMNVWGKEITLEGGVLRQWLPFKWRTATKDPVEIELERIGYYPSIPEDTVTIDGEKYDIPEKLYEDYRILLGYDLYQGLLESLQPDLSPEDAAMKYKPVIDALKRSRLEILKDEMMKTLPAYQETITLPAYQETITL